MLDKDQIIELANDLDAKDLEIKNLLEQKHELIDYAQKLQIAILKKVGKKTYFEIIKYVSSISTTDQNKYRLAEDDVIVGDADE